MKTRNLFLAFAMTIALGLPTTAEAGPSQGYGFTARLDSGEPFVVYFPPTEGASECRRAAHAWAASCVAAETPPAGVGYALIDSRGYVYRVVIARNPNVATALCSAAAGNGLYCVAR